MKENNDMAHTINGVKTDILVFIKDLIDEDENLEDAINFWSERLAEKCNIPISEAKELIKHHLEE
jgi:hypothetical protein